MNPKTSVSIGFEMRLPCNPSDFSLHQLATCYMAKFSFDSIRANTLIMFILILSVRAFSGSLTPDFDSDQAVHVLMAYDLRLPEDLYYWGQSRLGSLLPIVSHWLLKVSPLTPIEAVSCAQYFFLIVGFLCFVSLFRKMISKVVFTLIWFLPPDPFMALVKVAHPPAPQFALLGTALIFTNQLATISETQTVKKIVFSLIITSSLMLSVWVSDLSIIPAIVAGLFFSAFLQRHQKMERLFSQGAKNLKLSRFNLIYSCVFWTFLFWSTFLAYAKFNASKEDVNYGLLGVNSLDIILQISHSIVAAISNTLLFQVDSLFLSLYGVACLALISALIRHGFRIRQDTDFTSHLRWIPFFLTSALGTFLLLLMSRWTYIQGTPPRYFIGIYIFCWLSALLVFDNLDLTNFTSQTAFNRVSTLLVLTALLGSLSLPSYVFAVQKPQSRLSMLQPLASLGRVGFIGDYWTSYLMCIVAPDRLSCTPHDQDFARCPRCVKSVLKSPTINLGGRDWLDSFPEEIEQFGQRLRKQKPTQKIAGYWMAPYRTIAR